MKWLAWMLVPVAVGFVVWLFLSAEWESITRPPPHASRAAVADALLPVPSTDKSLHLLFVGDVMLDRGIAWYAAQSGTDSLFAGVRDLFGGEDAIVANLETALTTNASVSARNHADLRFTSDPAFAGFLRDIGVRAVSLSNNHTDDFGGSGLAETRMNLAAAGIARFGAPDNLTDLSTALELNHHRMCFVGYEGFTNPDPAPIVAEIAHLRPGCDFIAATMHAGEEYQASSTALQERAARSFIDAGADIVIGTHPHVVQPLEVYKGKPIFYSLGNFMFDQDFSWATEHGLAVEAAFDSASTTVRLIPTTIEYGRASVTGDTADYYQTLARLVTADTPPGLASAILDAHEFSYK